MQDYHRLEVWRRGMEFTVSVYKFAGQLPKEERYNLAEQMRRAAVSLPLNVAEGAGSETKPEFARFLGYSYRSVKEVMTCVELCQRLYPAVAAALAEGLLHEGHQIAGMLHTLIRRLGSPSPAASPVSTQNSKLKTEN